MSLYLFVVTVIFYSESDDGSWKDHAEPWLMFRVACHKQNMHHMLVSWCKLYSAETPANDAIKINLGGDAEPMHTRAIASMQDLQKKDCQGL